MKDELGTRMKEFYEKRTRIFLPRRTYTIVRIDGKAFHTYTRGLDKPFDTGFIEDMDETACYLCQNIQGAKFGFVQSDEISILLTDFDDLKTDAWFDGNIQKIVSVSGSLTTSKFNQLRQVRYINEKIKNGVERITDRWIEMFLSQKLAEFDSRAFTIPTKVEVENYFIWRQQDTVRNSISSVAQHLYSHKELNGKSTNQMQEMIFQKGINWNDYPGRYKRGRLIVKELNDIGRGKWVSKDAMDFCKNRNEFTNLIPIN